MKIKAFASERYDGGNYFIWLCSKIQRYVIVPHRASARLSITDKFNITSVSTINDERLNRMSCIRVDTEYGYPKDIVSVSSDVDYIMEKNYDWNRIDNMFLDSNFFNGVPFRFREQEGVKNDYDSSMFLVFDPGKSKKLLGKLEKYNSKRKAYVEFPKEVANGKYRFFGSNGKPQIVDLPLISIYKSIANFNDLEENHFKDIFYLIERNNIKDVYSEIKLEDRLSARSHFSLEFRGYLNYFKKE